MSSDASRRTKHYGDGSNRRLAGGGREFASRQTATTRSLQEFRKRKEKKFVRNAALLREYKKAMKAEGFDAGDGASRKRRDPDEAESLLEVACRDNGDSSVVICQERPKEENAVDREKQPTSKKPKRKMDPLAKARAQAEVSRSEREKAIKAREERQKMEVHKAQKRKKRYKQMMQRTKKGQPIMKNVIAGMLEKLQRDSG